MRSCCVARSPPKSCICHGSVIRITPTLIGQCARLSIPFHPTSPLYQNSLINQKRAEAPHAPQPPQNSELRTQNSELTLNRQPSHFLPLSASRPSIRQSINPQPDQPQSNHRQQRPAVRANKHQLP